MTTPQGKKIRNFSTLSWMICTFLLTTLFNNNILAILLTPKIIKIDSINELNQFGSSMTTIIKKNSYIISQNLVIRFSKICLFN